VFSVETGRENWPVVYVTWYGAKAFCEGNGWDLPREAEWEYACRGGRQYKYGTDDGTISSSKANYQFGGGYLGTPIDVKSYPKNPFGLYNMSGNVWEWCADWYGSYTSGSQTDPTGAQTDSFRVKRGGSYLDENIGTDYCRSAYRSYDTSDYRASNAGFFNVGFRVVRRVSP
jgi:formylglycine-generating enzyme required for sulfatase activity